MAVQETSVPIDDSGMLADLMSDAPLVEEAAQPRDEQGRFAPIKEAEPAPTPEASPVEATTEQPAPVPVKEDEAAQVPSWRLRELREAREAAERKAEESSRQGYALQQQLQAMQRELAALKQPKQEPVDFFANPDAAVDQRIAPVRSEMEAFKSELRLEMSRELAAVKHGEAAVAEMEQAIDQAMKSGHPDMASLSHRMRTSNNPAAVAMEWYKNNSIVKETGGDLKAYRSKVLDDGMKDPAYAAKVIEYQRSLLNSQQQPSNGRPNIQLPPSLSRASGAGLSQADLDKHDNSDKGLFEDALNYRR